MTTLYSLFDFVLSKDLFNQNTQFNFLLPTMFWIPPTQLGFFLYDITGSKVEIPTHIDPKPLVFGKS
ncbi:hypothetical protein CMK12_00005 [Candidatus Poribacteria bacterium]|nr:hypothetical protein [Candidatus Poribacteria bacterium]